MKNKRKTPLTLAIAISVCLSTAVPAYAGADYITDFDFSWEDFGDACYVIDFMDCDGNLLDSRICAYGDILTDIKIPETREDEEYIYQFVAWEPEVSETVTESAAYMATYQKIRKNCADDEDCTPEPVIQERPETPLRGASDGFSPEEITQVSAISHDVTRFTLNNSSEPMEEEAGSVPISTDTIPQATDVKEETVSETATPQPESPNLNPDSKETLHNPQKEANTPLTLTAPSNSNSPHRVDPVRSLDNAHRSDTVPVEEFPSEIATVATEDPLKEIPQAAPTIANSKRSKNILPSQYTKKIAENEQSLTTEPSATEPLPYKPSPSESSLSENKQSFKIARPVPLLLIGLIAYGAISKIINRRKRT